MRSKNGLVCFDWLIVVWCFCRRRSSSVSALRHAFLFECIPRICFVIMRPKNVVDCCFLLLNCVRHHVLLLAVFDVVRHDALVSFVRSVEKVLRLPHVVEKSLRLFQRVVCRADFSFSNLLKLEISFSNLLKLSIVSATCWNYSAFCWNYFLLKLFLLKLRHQFAETRF